jgi:hypothetical protein
VRRTNQRFFHVYTHTHAGIVSRSLRRQLFDQTFRRSPFFQRYPLLITASSRLPAEAAKRPAAAASPSSSSESSSPPLWSRPSAIAESVRVPGCATPSTVGPGVRGDGGTGSGEEGKTDSLSDSDCLVLGS